MLNHHCFSSANSNAHTMPPHFNKTTSLVKKGAFLSLQGGLCKQIYLIKSGICANLVIEKNGRETISRIISSGEIASFDGLYSGIHQSYCQALTDCLVYSFTDKELESLAATQQTGMSLLGILANQTGTDKWIYKGYRSRDRVIKFLLEMWRRLSATSEKKEFKMPMTRYQIGNYLGLSEETVCREMQTLIKQGFILATGKHYQLLKLDEMRLSLEL